MKRSTTKCQFLMLRNRKCLLSYPLCQTGVNKLVTIYIYIYITVAEISNCTPRQTPNMLHWEHHRLVLGQHQILANRSRTDNYQHKLLQGVQRKLRSHSQKGLGGRLSCIQFVFRVPAVIYSLILDIKVVLQGILEIEGRTLKFMQLRPRMAPLRHG